MNVDTIDTYCIKTNQSNTTQSQLKHVLTPNFSISDEMVKKAKSSQTHKCFMAINDEYILIEDGESLVGDIEKCKRLREKGVNYCGPVSYKVVDGKYYFLEYRAPGVQLQFSEYYGNIEYIEAFNTYLSRLELLANATQEQYNKFLDDIEMMKKESLKPDCCSLGNLFYDTEVGFSFIDVYPCNIRPNDSVLSVSNIFKIILNPKFAYKDCHVISNEELDKYNALIKVIYEKILNSLRLYNYSEDEIQKFLDKKIHVFSDEECVDRKDIEKYIKEHNNPYIITI